ncbi:MAG: pyrrolo-quinoline quinone [Acidobacteria bacterium]|nr:MAG: pyrrolo-quinoline quinone [Acidobacteriota bacterium]
MKSKYSGILFLAAAFGAYAADWLTFGGNPQRDGWAKHETILTRDALKDFSLQWKLHLDNEPKELSSLTAPLVVENVYTSRGVKDILVIAGSSDNLYAIDADSGKVFWQKKFTVEGKPKQQPHWLCPGGLNDTPTIAKDPGGLGKMTIFVIASDGKLHALNAVDGEDRFLPTQFVPPFSKNWSLNVHEGVIYTATSQNCNGARSAVYAMDLKDASHPIFTFWAKNGGIWGRAGVAIDPKGNVFAETGDGDFDPAKGYYSDTVLELSPRELKLEDFYTPANHPWITKKDLDMGNMSPVVFPFKQWELVAASGKEGVIYLMDAKSMGGSDHRIPLYRSSLLTNEDVNLAGRGFWGAFASWEDQQNTRWLYAPAWGPPHPNAPAFPITNGPAQRGSIMAFKVEEKDGKPVLSPAWISREMDAPDPPVIVNGMVFALSNGENTQQLDDAGKILNSKQRAENPSGNAVLYAFDAATGKELFSSGKTIPEFTHFSGLGVSNGKVFVTTYASNVYAFGVKQH